MYYGDSRFYEESRKLITGVDPSTATPFTRTRQQQIEVGQGEQPMEDGVSDSELLAAMDMDTPEH